MLIYLKKARSKFGPHFLLAPSAKVNSIKTFLRTVGTRGLFGGSFLWNSSHSVLLDSLILPCTWRVIDLKHSQS